MQSMEKPGGFAISLLGYLKAIRDGVCRRCGRPSGDPRGDPCGTVMPLEQLIEALERAQDLREGRPVGAERAGHCTCPPERVAALAAEVAEDLEKQRREPVPAREKQSRGGGS
jgi:hypothetical protein